MSVSVMQQFSAVPPDNILIDFMVYKSVIFTYQNADKQFWVKKLHHYTWPEPITAFVLLKREESGACIIEYKMRWKRHADWEVYLF